MSIKAISPLDGRYQQQLVALSEYFSEWALMKYRVHIEVEWLIQLSDSEWIPSVRSFSTDEKNFLRTITLCFDEAEAYQIKAYEKTTSHDVKAVEYYVKAKLANSALEPFKEFVHFACTSEDINNLSHALMLKDAMAQVWLPLAQKMVALVAERAKQTMSIAMLSHTHGQPATPTTLGKELAVFVYRWQRQLKQVENLDYLGKLNGAVGNYNAHVFAYPQVPWEDMARNFVERLGLTFNPLTTQIEPHDYMAEIFQVMIRFNNITLDFDRDMWAYISLGYFKQDAAEGEVGSSTMPHKVNPINFENSEANLIISSALFDCLANKLQVSRLQRDLSDSSALRNMGVGFGHSYVALLSTMKGMQHVSVNEHVINQALANSWEVLGEAIQTLMRKYGYENPYERLKELTRGQDVMKEEIEQFVSGLQVSPEDKKRLLAMRPESYVGLATQLTEHIFKDTQLPEK